MTIYEKRFLTTLINYRLDKEELLKKYEANDINELFIKSRMHWMKKYPDESGETVDSIFTEKFNKLVTNNLNASATDIINLRLVEEKTYQEISEIYNFTRTRAQQVVSNAVKKINRRDIVERLLFDVEPTVKPGRIEVKYEPHKRCGKLIGIITSSGLSVRTSNVLCNLIIKCHNENDIIIDKPEDFVPYLISPILYNGVGVKTAEEIINFFEPYVSKDIIAHWRSDIDSKTTVKKPRSYFVRQRRLENTSTDNHTSITYKMINGQLVKI